MTDPAPPPFVRAHLGPDEHLVWQGNPVGGFYRPGPWLGKVLLGIALIACGLALFASEATWPNLIPILMVGGVYLILIAILGSFYITTQYALTTRAAYIQTGMMRRKVEAFPIRRWSPITLEQDSRAGTVWFHETDEQGAEGGTYTQRVGFEKIADAEQVFKLMQQIKAQAE